MTEYHMNYVGGGLYGVKAFEAEAEKLGVARAIAARVLKTMKWGDPVLLAEWEPDREKQESWKQMTFQEGDLEKKVKFKRIGAARVFGYFRIVGLNMDASKVAKEVLAKRLTVIDVRHYGSGGMPVSRRCGSYVVGVTYFVAETIEEIISKAQEIEKDEKETGVKFKWYATGAFVPIQHVVLNPASFTRGTVKVEIEGLSLSPPVTQEGEPNGHGINFLYDYERRMYLPKSLRDWGSE